MAKATAEEAKVPDIRFGTDGWRGVMARDFTFDNVRRVAQALAEYLKALPPKQRGTGAVIVGYDQRFMSDAFAHEIARILEGNQFKPVMFAEPLPTPAVSFLTAKEKAYGVMVTASHNPASYNGVKIKLEGRAAPEKVTKAVETFLDKANPVRTGEVIRKSYRKAYLDYIKSRINTKAISDKLKKPVVVDYLFGCGVGLIEELVPSKKLITIHNTRDPLFGGLNPEPIEKNLKDLSARVVAEKAMIGVALDGDADRVGIVDEKGRYLNPCQVFPILLEYLITQRGIKGKIVQSVSMGYLSGRIAKAHGLEFEELPVGFKHVGEQIALGTAALGGEESGGYAWKGGGPERDGVLTGLLFLEMCTKLNKTPGQLWSEIETKYGKSAFTRVDFHIHKPITDKALFTQRLIKRLPKKILGSPIQKTLDIDGLKIILEGDHWLLMRPSGTEPLMRTYAESDSPKRTQELLALAQKWVHGH